MLVIADGTVLGAVIKAGFPKHGHDEVSIFEWGLLACIPPKVMDGFVVWDGK